ncbi:hypothetical protein JTE90_021846 [Oedothorax gibbosus]|uniref:Uncharacterized protein n=1 Tax=Oedothorax gibbosus TaxID=931172 RepID=A0AAV6V0H2_9ARAC|nr:hypothetical protein JTE90_021846 [Oedothorax gibbosus]
MSLRYKRGGGTHSQCLQCTMASVLSVAVNVFGRGMLLNPLPSQDIVVELACAGASVCASDLPAESID